MITLPQLITTDTDMTAGLTSGKTTGSAEDFLALLAGALGADGAQGKDARITLADLQAAGGKLSKELLTQHGEPGQAVKLADLLAQKANATDETLTDLTQAQHLLSTLTPSLKTSALAALSKTAQHDEKTPALSDEDLASLSALFAMLPGQPVATPVAGETPAENHIALPSLLRGDMPSAPQEETHTLSFSEHEKGKTEASLARASDDRATGPALTPLVVAAAATSAKVEVDSPPAPVTHGAAMPTLSSATAQPLPVASAPVLSAPLGSHEWQQTFSQQVMLFTRQGQQSAQLRLHPEELVRCIFRSSWMTIRRSSRWYRRTAMSAPRWKPPCPCCAPSWRKAAFSWDKAVSVAKALPDSSSLRRNNSLPAPNTRTRLALKMT